MFYKKKYKVLESLYFTETENILSWKTLLSPAPDSKQKVLLAGWNLNHIPSRFFQLFLKYLQAWGHECFPGDFVQVLDHHLSKELFSWYPVWTVHDAALSHSLTLGHQKTERSPNPSLFPLTAEGWSIPQSSLRRGHCNLLSHTFSVFHHLCCLPLNKFWFYIFSIPLVLWSPDLHTVLRWGHASAE